MLGRATRWGVLGWTLAAAVSCADSTAEETRARQLGQGCILNSDCEGLLVCVFERCHEQCARSRDCPPGQRCVAGTGDTNVCLFRDESECITRQGCQSEQICSEDHECRDPCDDVDECVDEQLCTTSGECAEADEVDANGALIVEAATDGGDGGTSGGNGAEGGTSQGEAGEPSTSSTDGGGGGSGPSATVEGAGGSTSSGGSTSAGGSAAAGGNTSAGGSGTGGGGTSGGGTGGSGGAGCVKAVYGSYLLRDDGRLLYVESTAQKAILSAETVLPLSGVTSVLQGANHGCASLEDGSAWCWPLTTNGNDEGQLGDGTTNTGALYRAVQVKTSEDAPLENVSAMASQPRRSGVLTSCAISDGGVWCWGRTDALHNDTPTNSAYAEQATLDGETPLTNVLQLSIGNSDYACALVAGEAGNEVWCWGANAHGQCGTGNTAKVQYPTKVLGLDDPTWVRAAGDATLALEGDGLKCWGRNLNGECATTTTDSPNLAPSWVKRMDGSALDGVVGIDAAVASVCALRDDRSPWCWGSRYAAYAAPLELGGEPVVGVAFLGTVDQSGGFPLFVSVDGKLHVGTTELEVNCGPLE